MILRAEIKFIKQPQVGDYIEFDLKADGISSIGTAIKIVFNNTSTSTTLGESRIGINITDTVNILGLKLDLLYSTTNDSNAINYEILSGSTDTLRIYYNTNIGNNGYTTFAFNSVPDVGVLVEVKQFIQSASFTPTGFIGVNSPYFITYNNTTDYDKINLDLTIWTGLADNKPDQPNYQFVKYKTSYTDTTTSINIAPIVRAFIDPKLNNNWLTGTTINGSFDECCYVSYSIYGLKEILDIDGNPTGEAILISSETDGKIATLGYGHFEDGPNPIITNPLATQTDYITFGDNEFVVSGITGTTSASTTNTAIIRTKIADRGICERVNKNYQVVYLNKNGVFVGFSFPKLSRKTIASKTDKFERLLKAPYQYSTTQHTSKVLNKSESLTYILNTNLLKETDVRHMQELIMSEKHYLIVDEKIIPVVLKDSDFEVKTSINNKAKIQYQLEFTAANEVKNNIQ